MVTRGGDDRVRWTEAPGAGPPRVFLHGLGSTARDAFGAAVAHPALVASGRRALLVDLVGHGASGRPEDFPYTLEAHADAVATALRAAGVGEVEVVGHSLGGAVAVVLADRHPQLVAALLLVDPNLDPAAAERGAGGSRGIAAWGEAEFAAAGEAELEALVGARWWASMRHAGRIAVHRSAVGLARGTVPTVRERLLGLRVPRTYLRPAREQRLGEAELAASGVRVVHVPDCGHDVMGDNPEGFVRAVASS